MNRKYVKILVVVLVAAIALQLIANALASAGALNAAIAQMLPPANANSNYELLIFLTCGIVFLYFLFSSPRGKTTLSSATLLLRPISPADADAIFSYRSLPEVAKYQYWPPYTMQQAQEFAQKSSQDTLQAKDSWVGLAIVLKASNKVIGDCAIKISANTAELGINIDPKYQGKGFGKEVFNLLSSFAFEQHLPSVFAIVDADNAASVRLLLAIGFERDTAFENKLMCKGAPCTEHKYIKRNPAC